MDSEHKWLRFEKLVAQIQRALAPNALVTHNDHIHGHESDTLRQIDVSVRQKVGQYDILIVIDCKDYQVPVDVNDVGGFITVVRDIGANKGAMVATNGFTDAAKNMGSKAGLDLYRLVDAEAHEWQTYVSIPVICDFRGMQAFQFSIPNSVATFLPSMDPNEIVVHYSGYPQPVTVVELLRILWNSGKLPDEPGEHRDIPLTRVITAFMDDKVFEAGILAHIVVERRLFFGQLPLIDVKGFRNEYTGNILTNGFTTDWLDVIKVEKEWRRIETEDEIAITPTFKLEALDNYTIKGKVHKYGARGLKGAKPL